MSSIQIANQSVRVLLRYMDQQHLDAPRLRQRIKKAQQQPRIDIQEWWSLLDSLSSLAPQTALGIRIGQLADISDAGIVGYLVASCDTFHEAMLRMQKYEPILHNLSYTWIRAKNDYLQIGWESNGNYSTVISNDLVISSLLTLFKKLLDDKSFDPIEVALVGISEEELEDYQCLLRCPVKITNDLLAIKVPLSALQLPINSEAPELKAILEAQAEAMLTSLPTADDFLKQFQSHVMKGLETQQVNMKWLASQMSIPERTLYRMLAERGRSYQNLLDELRLQLALRYLRDNTLSLSEISIMLGFSEQSAFTRAFKKWTGQPPRCFRKSNE